MSRSRFLGLGLSFVLLLGACSSNESSETAAGDESNESFEDVWADFESPLGEYLGQPSFSGDQAELEAQFADQERQAGVKITECMANEGFEYVHPDTSGGSSIFGDEDGLEWGSRAWVEKYGYGVTTQAFGESQVAPEAVGYPDDAMSDSGDDFTDPNQEYVSSLSESERMAYEEALWGEQPEVDESMTEEEMDAFFEDFEPTGCQTTAYEEVFAGEDSFMGFYEAFGDELDEMYQRMEADPRFVAAQDEIRTCVEEKGLTYVSEEDAYEHFGSEVESLQNELYSNQPAPEMPAGFDEMTIEEQDAWYAENEQLFAEPELSADQKARLAEMQAEEIEIAVASYDCGGSWVQQADLYQELIVEYETEFIETHGDEMQQYKAE